MSWEVHVNGACWHSGEDEAQARAAFIRATKGRPVMLGTLPKPKVVALYKDGVLVDKARGKARLRRLQGGTQ